MAVRWCGGVLPVCWCGAVRVSGGPVKYVVWGVVVW